MRNRFRLITVGALSVTVMSVAAFAYNFNSNQQSQKEVNSQKEIKLDKEIKNQDSYNGSKLDFSLYSDYGDFSYDKDNNLYTFDDTPIRFFYDEKPKTKTDTGYKHNIFIHNDSNAPDGVMIRIVRNSNGDIENLIQMTEEEAENFIANTKSLGGMTL